MANVRAFRSGNWSDTNPATSPWGTGGALYAPAANDDVYSNTFTIHVDTNVTVNSVTNASATSRLWKDGATTTAAANGTFNLLDGFVLAAGSVIGNNSSSVVISTVSLTGTNTGYVVSNSIIGGVGNANQVGVTSTSSGILYVTGAVSGGSANNGNCSGIVNIGPGSVIVTGNCSGGSSTGSGSPVGINNSSVGSIILVGNSVGGSSGSTSFGINNSSTGTAIIVGNVVATSATNAFVSSNANAINKISGNIINNSNGTAAIYAARYVVDPVPTNSVIQYSNTNMFTTDSLSAFSMPPVSAVRSGVSFANSTLTGTCKVPSANSVNIGVPVDNTVGTAFLTPATLFDTSVASLTASDSLGARLKNSATVQSVGNIIASFSN